MCSTSGWPPFGHLARPIRGACSGSTQVYAAGFRSGQGGLGSGGDHAGPLLGHESHERK